MGKVILNPPVTKIERAFAGRQKIQIIRKEQTLKHSFDDFTNQVMLEIDNYTYPRSADSSKEVVQKEDVRKAIDYVLSRND
ncbi:MAG: hypothetical protein GQ474_01555 [Sulfurimonas sp.]|nr:hypothetical protein [Sulfurimonas sp.]